jgi:hypothetical protein
MDGSVPARSPEREKLAGAIEAHQAAQGRLERLRTALAKATEDSIDALELAESRERELAEAEQTEPSNLAALAFGEVAPLDVGTLVDQAERRLAEAKEAHRQKRELRSALEAEIEAQRTRCSYTEMGLEAAIRGVIEAEPEPTMLIAETQAALAHLSAVIAPLEMLGPVRLPQQHQWIFTLTAAVRNAVASTGRPLPEAEQLLPAWAAALQGLHQDPDTALPQIRQEGH